MSRDTDLGLRVAGIAFSAVSIALALRSSSPANKTVPSTRADSSEVEALARAIRSEVDGFSLEVKTAAAWVVRNRARARRTTIRRLLRGTRKAWGRQLGGDPPFSSRLAGRPADQALARRVLRAPQGSDPTHGATSFLEPALYARQYAEGKVRRSLEELRAKWQAEGGRLLYTIGPLEFWT